MREVPVSEAIAAQRPEWIGLIVSRRSDGYVNMMPAGWVMRTSGTPPMFATAIAHDRYTNELIRQAGEFVIAFPSEGMGEAIWFCGSRSGRDIDKVAKVGLKLSPAKRVKTPLLANAYINLECQLAAITETGDHTIFVGEVVAAHLGDAAGPLVNFGTVGYALAQPVTDTLYRPPQ